MPLRKIIKLKEFVKDSRARELKEVDMQIKALKEEVKHIDLQAESVNEELKLAFSHSLLIRYKALMAKKKELTERIRQLELLKVEKGDANNLEPSLAAEILLNLRERQAAAILEAMDPQKAAEVSRIVLERRRKR